MAFQRFSIAPIGVIAEPENKKLVFASDGSLEPVYFDYDPDSFVYFRCRAITADESNGNGDYFPEEEVKKAAKSFIGVGLYKDHQSDSVDKSIGKVLWAEWVPNGKYVECICVVDKHLAPDLAYRVKQGIATSVSMGCSVQEAVCSVCGNIAHNINELCMHMQPGFGQKGRRDAAGKIIYEINKGIQFNELSLVTVPADPTARIFEIYASLNKRASEKALSNLKEQYLKLSIPGAYERDGYQEEILGRTYKQKGKGKQENVYNDDALQRQLEASMIQLNNLTPAELDQFRKWIIQTGLKPGLLGEATRIEDDELVSQKRATGKKLWQLADVDTDPAQANAVKSFRGIKDSDPDGVARADEYYAAIDKAVEAQRQLRDMVQAGRSEEELRSFAEDNVRPLMIDAKQKELVLQRNFPRIYYKMLKAYDQYSLYRGYTDVSAGEKKDLKPLDEVVKEIAEHKPGDVKRLKFKEQLGALEKAYRTISNGSFEEFYNSVVQDPSRQVGPEGFTDEVIDSIIKIYDNSVDFDAFLGKAEEMKSEQTEIEKATEGLSEAPLPGVVKTKERQEKQKQREEERGLEKAKQLSKAIEDIPEDKPGVPAPKEAPQAEPVPQEEERAISFDYIKNILNERGLVDAFKRAKDSGLLSNLIDYQIAENEISDLEYVLKNAPEVRQEAIDKLRGSNPELAKDLEKKYSLTSSSSDDKDNVVIKIHNSMEDEMALSIGYSKGSSLATSFFEAKQGNNSYRVSVAEVLPLSVQEAINQNDPRVATPNQIVADLTAKFASLDGFKNWAKKRRKKNKRAMLRMMPKEDLANKMQEPKAAPVVAVSASETEPRRDIEMKDNAIPKSAAQETETPATPVTEAPKEETKIEGTVETPVETKPAVEPGDGVQAAMAALVKFVESKLGTTAVQTVKMEAKVDGVAKPQAAPEPKGAIKEVTKTENPKGFVDTAALKAEAMDENWTVNQKELEKEPKMEFGDHPLPPDMSVDEKEVNKEATKVKNSNQHASKVKKYFGRLGPGAEGEPELAMDLKSSTDVKLLREALAKEQADKQKLLEEKRMQHVADKIFNIVATLRDKKLVSAGKEEIVIDTLTKRFADAEALDGLLAVVETLEALPAEETAPAAQEEPGVVPQVFDTVETGKDAAELLSEIWNK